ncbi:hypothetical protein [Cochleicola gelatinilyticus]|uniref:Uncharacterized protein n=1 Tax=Cochleicola gelatinilyticus TaxID=1763537 RepID=A0A167EZN0_9FLAO|nr:hypothetical protein [Cochleicola gelatinilyticus]OAB76042.1 hypothetical protein ULVI_13340 [Cochleicola gelatinilyticus]
MFKQVISHKGFWRSVFILGVVYMSILVVIQWAFTGFSLHFFETIGVLRLCLVFVAGAFVCGFSVSYAKFWGKLKSDQYKK